MLSFALVVILYLIVPWTAVNLGDFFFIRRGHYAVTELFDGHGIYGEWAWRGLLAYALVWAAILPFAVLQGLWTGPLANKIGGVDIGWLIGLLISDGSYFILSKGINVAAEGSYVERSQYDFEKIKE
jgi:NCS1 family nucleobase:cation symporter-1